MPAGFVNKDEPLEAAARRELEEETGLISDELRQVKAFGDPGRDPRGWTVSIAFVGFVSSERQETKGADDAKEARWFPLDQLPALAFDHDKIISAALESGRHSVKGAL